jgi:hypothetical protein
MCSTTPIALHNAEVARLFGPFFRPYRDDYRPVPFSRNYVRHIEGGTRRSIRTRTLPRPSRCG